MDLGVIAVGVFLDPIAKYLGTRVLALTILISHPGKLYSVEYHLRSRRIDIDSGNLRNGLCNKSYPNVVDDASDHSDCRTTGTEHRDAHTELHTCGCQLEIPDAPTRRLFYVHAAKFKAYYSTTVTLTTPVLLGVDTNAIPWPVTVQSKALAFYLVSLGSNQIWNESPRILARIIHRLEDSTSHQPSNLSRSSASQSLFSKMLISPT